MNDTSILVELGAMRSPFESRLVKRAVQLTLLPFALTLLLDTVAALRLGVPPPGSRHLLAGLYDPVYQSFWLTVALTALLLVAFFKFVPIAFARLAGQRVIAEKKAGSTKDFVDTYGRWLEHPSRFLLGAAFGAVALIVVYTVIFGEDISRLLPGNEPPAIGIYSTVVWLTNWINGVGIVFALFVGGSLFFRLVATAMLIYKSPEYFEYDIQPSHPDR